MASTELMLDQVIAAGTTSTTVTAIDKEYQFNARDDEAKYNEVMKPWDIGSDGEQFEFKCYTKWTPPKVKVKQSCWTKLKKALCGSCMMTKTNPKGWATAVYHKKGSDRLMIKRNNFEFSRRPKDMKACCCMRLCCQCDSNCIPIQEHESLDMVTQSIPIQSIFFVERNVTQKGDVLDPAGCCACLIRCLCCCCVSCCYTEIPSMTNYSEISIGYNRSNESNKIHHDKHSDRRSDETTDYITLILEANQSYNLHRYLNDILDKTAPRKDVLVDSGLPR